MNDTKKWFAVYTRPKAEKKVTDNLSKKGIENYTPLNRVLRQWSDRKKLIYEPLFTSYVFVRVSEQQLQLLRQVEGVVNIVYWLSKPAVIRDAEIDTIKRFLKENTNVQLERTTVNINDNVRILGGAFMDQEGQIMSVTKKTVKVLLPSMGYLMIAEVEATNVEVVSTRLNGTHRELYSPMKMVQ